MNKLKVFILETFVAPRNCKAFELFETVLSFNHLEEVTFETHFQVDSEVYVRPNGFATWLGPFL